MSPQRSLYWFGRSGTARRLARMPSRVSCLSQSSTAANQCSSLSTLPSLLMVLAPVKAVSFSTSDRSSTKQWACRAATIDDLPSRPHGWRAKCNLRNGIPCRTRKSMRWLAPSVVLCTFDSPAYDTMWNSTLLLEMRQTALKRSTSR